MLTTELCFLRYTYLKLWQMPNAPVLTHRTRAMSRSPPDSCGIFLTVPVPITHLVYHLIVHARLPVLIVPFSSCPPFRPVHAIVPSNSCPPFRPAPARRPVRFVPSIFAAHARLSVRLVLILLSSSCPSSSSVHAVGLTFRLKPVYLPGFFEGKNPSIPLSGSNPCIYPASFEGNSPLIPSPAHAEFPLPLSSGLLNSLDRFSASSVLHPPQLAAPKTRPPTARSSSRASRRRQSQLHSASSPGQ